MSQSTRIQRLMSLGPSSLSDHELSQVVFETDAHFSMAQRNALVRGSRLGLPSAVESDRLAQLCAWHHLKLRWLSQDLTRQALTHPGQVKDYLQHRLGTLPQEQVMVLYLAPSLHLLDCRIIAKGTVNEARVYPRELIRGVIETGASSVILAHNHPSGQLRASATDIALTDNLASLLKGLAVELVDHFVVTAQGIASIRAENKVA